LTLSQISLTNGNNCFPISRVIVCITLFHAAISVRTVGVGGQQFNHSDIRGHKQLIVDVRTELHSSFATKCRIGQVVNSARALVMPAELRSLMVLFNRVSTYARATVDEIDVCPVNHISICTRRSVIFYDSGDCSINRLLTCAILSKNTFPLRLVLPD
jgi:hypothetical protein